MSENEPSAAAAKDAEIAALKQERDALQIENEEASDLLGEANARIAEAVAAEREECHALLVRAYADYVTRAPSDLAFASGLSYAADLIERKAAAAGNPPEQGGEP